MTTRDEYDSPWKEILSFAILADENPRWYIQSYEQELWGCRTKFEFPTVKLLAYRDQWGDSGVVIQSICRCRDGTSSHHGNPEESE